MSEMTLPRQIGHVRRRLGRGLDLFLSSLLVPSVLDTGCFALAFWFT